MKLSETGQPDNDKVLAKIEKKINKEYTIANKEMEKKLKNYMKKFEAKDKEKKKLVKSGQLSQDDYIKWRQDKIVVGEQWESMCKVLAEDLDNSRIIAQHIVSNDLPTVYANGVNYGTYEIEKTGINTNFTLYNHDAVEILVSENPKLYPDPTMGSETWQKLKSKEVQKWSKAKINSSITQAILQGEAIDQIAKRLRKVTDMDYKASIRNARTMVGAAQNAGHQRSYERAENMGVNLVKVWVSTIDMRTRHTHAVMDGEAVPVKEKFSNGLLYPRDILNGTPAEVYNCRCRPLSQVKGFEKTPGSLIEGKQDKLNGMTYDEWKQYHQDVLDKKATAALKKETEKVKKYEVVNGENILETWERRKGEFAFEIEDVINAQGFDGLPRVVSAEEFDKAVQESKFIAQRTYSAESKEILDQYRDELYHGKWYVDCSTGGAQYGQGMYCAANYNGQLTDGIKGEMDHYRKLGESRCSRRLTDKERYDMALKSLPDDISEDAKGYLKALSNGSFTEQAKYFGKIDKNTENLVSKAFNSVPINSISVSYTETFTLDSSAKFVDYRKLHDIYVGNLNDEYRDVITKEVLSEKITSLSKDEATLLQWEANVGVGETKVSWREANEASKSLTEDRIQELHDMAGDARREANERFDKLRDKRADESVEIRRKYKDEGSFATALGYDAINAEGHGLSDSYTVILNRTKVIFKKP